MRLKLRKTNVLTGVAILRVFVQDDVCIDIRYARICRLCTAYNQQRTL